MKEIIKGIIVFVCSGIGFFSYYPILPAVFAVFSIEGRATIWVMIGAVLGTVCFMPMSTMLKYLFILLVIGLSIHFYIWANRCCNNWIVSLIAAGTTIVMNYASNLFDLSDTKVLLGGIFEGLLVFGLTIGIHYASSLPLRFEFAWQPSGIIQPQKWIPAQEQHTQKMESFASAVNGLSEAFFVMSQPKELLVTDEVGALEQEVTGKLCANCDGCAVCWNENRMRRQSSIRALLHAVVNHSTKEELLESSYIEDCKCYSSMVDEALWAFGRLQLNLAWYNRLRENRYVIAQQLDAMAGLMEEWANAKKNVDRKHQLMMGQIAFEAKEKGLVVEDLHIYEEKKRLCVEGFISSKWDGGIPVKHYLAAVEKACKKPMRLGKDAKSILTKQPAFISIYEDTHFYGLQGIATEKKNGSFVNGDSYSFFAMDDGKYHICLSDGMGSGSRASQESEMVVDLLQKFIEAGFKKETAIKLMNSAMVLQGEENTFSTLDYAQIDLYSGALKMIKIGGAATFIKRGNMVECIDQATLPAGADVRMEVESTKRQLRNGDFLVMLTDGVVEYLHVDQPKETLTKLIADTNTENAGVLAESILKQVLNLTGGLASDDMTVLVTGIWEK